MSYEQLENGWQSSGNTVALNVTGASARVALPTFAGPSGETNGKLRIYVKPTLATNTEVYAVFGDVTVTAVAPVDGAAANGVPWLANMVEIQRVPANCTHVAAIASAGTATIFITAGFGD